MKTMASYENAQSATSDLPFGAFSDESSAGSNDGTDIVACHMQDVYYALYQILQLAGQTPNGSLEDGNTSKQFLSALSNVSTLLYNSTTTYGKGAICFNISGDNVTFYKSKVASNSAALSNTTNWATLCVINSSGVFANMSLSSPALSGTPTAPTASAGTNNTQIATTAFVKSAFQSFIKITKGTVQASGSSHTFTVTPPTGYTMSDLAGFIPSISYIYFSGDVDGNDKVYCSYSVGANNITVTVYASEQNAQAKANWLAIWIKQ